MRWAILIGALVLMGNTEGVLLVNDSLRVNGPIDVYDSAGDGAYWREFHIPASKIEPAAAGATPTVINSATFVYLLNADTEYLYFGTDIHDDWDESSDIIIEIQVALSGAETADDVIQAEIVAEYVGEHEDINTGVKTQTRSIDHDIGALAGAGDVHHLAFVLDYDLESHVVQVDDNLSLRFRLDVVGGAGNVAAVWLKGANIKYRTSKPQLETSGTFPTEG